MWHFFECCNQNRSTTDSWIPTNTTMGYTCLRHMFITKTFAVPCVCTFFAYCRLYPFTAASSPLGIEFAHFFFWLKNFPKKKHKSKVGRKKKLCLNKNMKKKIPL